VKFYAHPVALRSRKFKSIQKFSALDADQRAREKCTCAQFRRSCVFFVALMTREIHRCESFRANHLRIG